MPELMLKPDCEAWSSVPGTMKAALTRACVRAGAVARAQWARVPCV